MDVYTVINIIIFDLYWEKWISHRDIEEELDELSISTSLVHFFDSSVRPYLTV
jgi:hypothetical protein